MDRKLAGILIFDDVEVLDFTGPFEVFSVTRLDETRRYETKSPLQPVLIAQAPECVVTSGGMTVAPQVSFRDCPPLDVLVVPGGIGTRREMRNETMLSFVRSRAPRVEVISSVCTGALVLASAGLLDGVPATTHWRSLEFMQQSFPNIIVDRASHFVESGKVYTSAGISAGIDMALKIVSRFYGETIARATARHIEYPYPDASTRRIDL